MAAGLHVPTSGRTIIASAPTRLDFGGGWTDVPPYTHERGGYVCNLAIERRATVSFTLASPAEEGQNSRDPLTVAALRRSGLAAARVEIHSDFPFGAGLGGSSSVGVALAAAIAHATGTNCSAAELAERSRSTEVEELGVAGGFQDHYAAAFGGALGLSFSHTNSAEPIPLTDACVEELECSLTLVYTGESRISGETISAVLDAYKERVPRVVKALDYMASLARTMRDALTAGDVAHLAACIDEHWQYQRSLHERISTPRIDALEQAVRAVGATGFKALGASGGGSVLICSSREKAEPVRAAASSLGDVLTWRVARDGVRVSTA
ncbi:MAG TPA: hypothetical protein VGE27_02410 [Gemmatimonas sp.]|uniref:GHMP family kinase ATP-binding protein n=1 Tax=Gemmatimonas sp. TaxID=1962908 RepID=UPI002EDB7912